MRATSYVGLLGCHDVLAEENNDICILHCVSKKFPPINCL